MSEQNRRITDHRAEDWSAYTRNEGIGNRIKFAMPGQELAFRGDLETIAYDEIREFTWGEVVRMLAEQGILQISDDKVTKKTTALGKHSTSSAFKKTNKLADTTNMEDVVEKADKQRLASLNLKNPQDRRKFIGTHLKREMRNSMIQHGAFDFSDNFETILDTVVECTNGMTPKVVDDDMWESTSRNLYQSLKTKLISSGLKDIPEGWEYNGKKKDMPLGVMLQQWGASILYAIRDQKK